MKDIFRLKLSDDKEIVIKDSEAIFGSGVIFALAGLALNSPETIGVGVGLTALGVVVNIVPSPSEKLKKHKQQKFSQLLDDLKRRDTKDKKQ